MRIHISFLLALLPLLAQDTTGVGGLIGTITDSKGQPAPSVKVCVVDSTRCTTSDSRGFFRLPDLRPADYQLDITAAGKPSIRSSVVSVRAGLEGKVEVALPAIEALQQSLTVSESVFVAPEEIKSSSYIIQSEELFKAAGARQDISRYVQLLPGVAIGAADFRNDIIVRGGSPLENLFIVDNIEIPNINAFANFASAGGTTSILDAQLIRDVTFLTGGQPAPFINRASSVLQVAQTEGSREKLRGRLTVGDPGIGGIIDGPLKKGKGSWILSARRSYLDLFTKDIGIGGVPILYTYNAKVLYDLSPRDRVWGVSISGSDDIRLGPVQGKPRKLEDEGADNIDVRYGGWRSANGFNWQRLYGARGVGLLGVSHSEARVDQQVKDLIRNGIPTATVNVDDLLARSPIVYRERSREGETTIKYDYTGYLPMLEKLQVGGSFKMFRVNYNAAAPLGSESPYSAVRDLNPFNIVQDFSARQSSAYVQSTRNLSSRWNLTWGGRIDNYQFIARTRFSPRAGISYRISDKLSWRASFGTYFQQPQFLFLAAFPQNRNLTPFRSQHLVTGITYIPTASLRFTVEAYQKDYKDYPVSTQFPALSLASTGDTFQIRDVLFPLTSAGRGRARGIEFFAEKKWGSRWFGNANLSLSQSRQGGLDGILRPSTFDFPVIFNSVGGYRLNKKWEFSARTTVTSGRPYTPFNVALSTAQRREIFDLTRINELRVPAYIRVDVRVDRTFTFKDKPLLVFLGAQNVTNRNNISGFQWSRRANIPRVNEQLGLFPVIGLNWIF